MREKIMSRQCLRGGSSDRQSVAGSASIGGMSPNMCSLCTPLASCSTGCHTDLPSSLKLLLLNATSIRTKTFHIQDLILDEEIVAPPPPQWSGLYLHTLLGTRQQGPKLSLHSFP